MTAPDSAVPERASGTVLRCSSCGFTTFEEHTARAHVEHDCGEAFELVERST
jgi:hypothetical protein